MAVTNHSAAAGIHPGAYVQSSDPGAVGAKILWIDTAGSSPIWKKRNATNTGWDVVGVSAAAVDLTAIDARGTHAARPAASQAGKLYYETDTGIIFRDNGSSW